MTRPSQLPEGFTAFWAAYPRRVNKGAAFKSWISNNCEPISSEIVKAVKSAKWADEKQYIPHASTWLNGWRWTDELEQSDDNNALKDALRGL